jgi:hypothetical protein
VFNTYEDDLTAVITAFWYVPPYSLVMSCPYLRQIEHAESKIHNVGVHIPNYMSAKLMKLLSSQLMTTITLCLAAP